LLKPRSSISAGLDAAGAWAIRFPAPDGIKFNAVMRGACWVSVEGDEQPRWIEEGDCFLLTRARPFTLASDLSLATIEARIIYEETRDGIATCNGGGDFFLIGGRFAFAGQHAELLFGSLPAIVHVREASGQASVLRWSLDQLAAELRDRQPGGFLVSEHLAHIMLVQVLRLFLTAQHGAGVGWFYALCDRQLRAVVGAMHADPARRWSLRELAVLAGMSRSTFAQKFKQVVGASPMEYLTRWRMLVAGDRLRSSSDNIASIALSVGYESESAFSTVFKRTVACSPRQYRLRQAGSVASDPAAFALRQTRIDAELEGR
jgi:AraC-like DNA-binding protein